MAALQLYLRSSRWAAPLLRSAAPVRGKRKKARAATAVDTVDNEDAVDLGAVDASMSKVLESLTRNLGRLRASGASADMLDDVRVDAYGARSPLRDLAQVSVRDGRTLDVNVFDPNVAANVERAIRNAGLNLNPVADARGIRVPVPKVDRNAREALRKKAQGEAERAKIAARHVRRDALAAVKKAKDDLPSAEIKILEKQVQKATDDCVGSIERLALDKVRDIDRA